MEFNGRIFLVMMKMLVRFILVYELDLWKKKWVKMDGLNEVAIFINGGGGGSSSVGIATVACVTKRRVDCITLRTVQIVSSVVC